MKQIALLGATGSIGTSTLEVMRAYPEAFRLVSFSFHRNLTTARAIIQEFQPEYVAAGTESDAAILSQEFPAIQVGVGVAGLEAASVLPAVDVVLTAVSGSVGLLPTLAAIKAGKDIALANKETLVMAGEWVMAAVKAAGVTLLPVDSEHSAIFQCLQGETQNLDRLVITASGGSFRDLSREDLKQVTLTQALAHPNWSMGKKITIDSSTMMNKGLEVIEAHWLFGVDYDKIDVVLHRESIVHSLIQLRDGAFLAQLGPSDMREPIQYALTYPDRWPIEHAKPFELAQLGQLHFEPMSMTRFPMLALAYEVGKKGGAYPTVYNAANEIAAQAFMDGKISYLAIETAVNQAVAAFHEEVTTLERVIEVDQETRQQVTAWIEGGKL